MITAFPALLPDELLYSACARYEARMAYASGATTNEELFGSRYQRPVIDFPSRLDRLVQSLPPGARLSSDAIIRKHTLLPYFLPFLPPDRVPPIESAMKGDHSGVHTMVYGGVKIRRLRRLRYCPECLQHDKAAFGEAYWHRVHQLPGVLVCPLHGVPLGESDVTGTFDRCARFHLPPDTADSSIPGRVDDRRGFIRALARDALWLLEHYEPAVGLDSLKEKYVPLLVDHGYVMQRSGRVKIKPLAEDLVDHYSRDFLDSVGCSFESYSRRADTGWLAAIVRRIPGFQHPLHHLLLIRFLGLSVEQFLLTKLEYRPWGDGPEMCRNPVCSEFEKRVIASPSRYTFARRWSATFQCPQCGFTYRLGPGTPKGYRIVDYGPIFRKELLARALVHTQSQLAVIMGVSEGCVRSELRRLRGGSAKRISAKPSDAEVAEYRQCFIQAREAHRGEGRVVLRKQAHAVFEWLRRYDPEWLWSMMPERLPLRRVGRPDWGELDLQYLESAKDAVKRILGFSDRLARITVGSISREMHLTQYLDYLLDKLPMTKSFVLNSCESKADYALRRLKWLVEGFVEKGKVPPRSTLRTRARLRYLPDNEAAAALDWGLRSIHDKLDHRAKE